MKPILITTCGAGGGINGPNYVYPLLSLPTYDILMCDTFPNNLEMNIGYMLAKVEECEKRGYREIILMGWSMGGATIINVAYHMKYTFLKDVVKGLILLATQEYKTENLFKLDCPVLFIHGIKDTTLPYQITVDLHHKYPHRKNMIILKHQGHQFSGRSKEFADFLTSEIINFFGS